MANKEENQLSAINHLAKVFADSIKDITGKLSKIEAELTELKKGMSEGNSRAEELHAGMEELKAELSWGDSQEGYTALEEAVMILKGSGDEDEDEDEEEEEAPVRKPLKKKRR